MAIGVRPIAGVISGLPGIGTSRGMGVRHLDAKARAPRVCIGRPAIGLIMAVGSTVAGVRKHRAGYIWVGGRYDHNHRWIKGYWERHRRGHVWVPGYWNRGGQWIAGTWRVEREQGKNWADGRWSKNGYWVPGRWQGPQARRERRGQAVKVRPQRGVQQNTAPTRAMKMLQQKEAPARKAPSDGTYYYPKEKTRTQTNYRGGRRERSVIVKKHSKNGQTVIEKNVEVKTRRGSRGRTVKDRER